ncbi:MAG: DUF4138 domain-containing protein [Cyclobacteriaceae bacterium]
MKYWLVILVNSIMLGKVYSQNYDTIPVGYTTSVNLIFDSPVKQWDMGLGLRVESGLQVWDVLVENSPESPSRIKLAAGIEEFKTTNLFVETTTAYYNFILKYEDRPGKLLYKIEIKQAEIIKENRTSEIRDNISQSVDHDAKNTLEKAATEFDSLEYFAHRVLESEDSFNPIGKSSQQILFFLSGIYVRDDHLFFKLYLRNESNIPYDIGFIGFFKSDRGKSGNKKRPRQEEHLTPEFVLNEGMKTLESNTEIFKVMSLQRFTLDNRKRLYIQLWEGNGGERKIELVVKGKDLLKAIPLVAATDNTRSKSAK